MVYIMGMIMISFSKNFLIKELVQMISENDFRIAFRKMSIAKDILDDGNCDDEYSDEYLEEYLSNKKIVDEYYNQCN